ncbi:hypothetical protein V6N13_051125 [Hibiscus sabdariffa]|uniref:Uncharacterized protein n=1 Tax=Hibiscus sabdariffa TaxID=183260 RepID=A0ABR2T3B8_9ROSI
MLQSTTYPGRTLLTEDWILKVAGFKKEENSDIGDSILPEHCGVAEEFVGSGRRIFLCVQARETGDFVTACLTTVAWLTGLLPSPTDAELQQT